MTLAEAIAKIEALPWTQEIRSGHPWEGDLLVRKSDVRDILKEVRSG
jgi:hypothetical protein